MGQDTINISAQSEKRSNVQLKTEVDEGQLSLDVFEVEESIFLVAPVAGVDEKSISVNITDDLLTISGDRPRPASLPESKKYYTEECYWGRFSRNILLPTAINSAEITARIDRDIIIVEIPKARKVASKNIPLSSSS